MIHSKTSPAPQTCMSGVLSTYTRLPGFRFIVVCTNIEKIFYTYLSTFSSYAIV